MLTALVALLVAAVAMTVTAVVSRRVGRVSVVDVLWGIGLILVALVALLLGDGTLWRRWLLLVLVAVWGGRLSWHIYRRQRGEGEDPRYAALLEGGGFAVAVRKVFVIQGVAIWFVGWPLIAAGTTGVEWVWAVVLGVVLYLVGNVFETVGDAQLAAYKRDPDRGPVLDTGLWAWTRHPNYFGDACVWWGLWAIGGLASGWLPALVTVPAPAAMSYFLVWATGARPLEKTMMQRPGYREYAARTSFFVPLPPKRS